LAFWRHTGALPKTVINWPPKQLKSCRLRRFVARAKKDVKALTDPDPCRWSGDLGPKISEGDVRQALCVRRPATTEWIGAPRVRSAAPQRFVEFQVGHFLDDPFVYGSFITDSENAQKRRRSRAGQQAGRRGLATKKYI
jgi:hypothetical protein